MKTSFLKTIVLLFLLGNFSTINAQEQCLKNAWEAFKIGDYEIAIIHCDQCILQFDERATEMQKELEMQGKTDADFPTNKISDTIKETIFANWAINDLATACFVKALSAEQIYRRNRVKYKAFKHIATEAYSLTSKYSLGRCWDPHGWFWNPAAEAESRGEVR